MNEGAQRLERSRLAILEHIHRKEQRRHGTDPGPAIAGGEEGVPPPPRRARGRGPSNWFGHLRDIVDHWWRYHPAHMAVDIARPALSSYAKRKPLQYLGIAAVAGAGLFFLRPWKLISVTGILVALAKSPQVAALVMQAMSSSQNPRDDEPIA